MKPDLPTRDRPAELTACRDCDLLLQEPGEGGLRTRCPRCGHVLQSPHPDNPSRCLAASLAGLVLLGPALSLPLVHFEMFGRGQHTSVLDSMVALAGQQQWRSEERRVGREWGTGRWMGLEVKSEARQG